MKMGIVSITRAKTNPPFCDKCGIKINVGEKFYFATQSKKRYCESCGDKLYHE